MKGRAGLTLAELILAMALSGVVFGGIIALSAMATRRHAAARGEQAAALDVSLLAAGIERELCGASLLSLPAPGLPSGSVEGCANAAVLAGGSPAPLDGGRPMRGFAVCQSEGVVYLHAADGACPLSYSCGVGGTPLSGSPSGGVSAGVSFLRPTAYSPVIEGRITVSRGGDTRTRDIACTLSIASGWGQ